MNTYNYGFTYEGPEIGSGDDIDFYAEYKVIPGRPQKLNMPAEWPEVEILKIHVEEKDIEVDADLFEVLANHLIDKHEDEMLEHANEQDNDMRLDEADRQVMEDRLNMGM